MGFGVFEISESMVGNMSWQHLLGIQGADFFWEGGNFDFEE